MKTILLGIATFLMASNIQAQNNNSKSEVKTTVITTKDSEGEQKTTKTQNTEEVQKIELKDANSKVLNKEMKETPVNVTTTTKLSANGITEMINVNRSAYYDLKGKRYQIENDKGGYTVFHPDGKMTAVLRKTSNNNYIYKTKNTTSFGHFDRNGNLILETYDDKTDQITLSTYTIIKD
jgi:hypothetical protein